VNSLFHYPSGDVFFTTRNYSKIGDIPFTTSLQSPHVKRRRILSPQGAEHYEVDVRQYVWIKTVNRQDATLPITANRPPGHTTIRARK